MSTCRGRRKSGGSTKSHLEFQEIDEWIYPVISWKGKAVSIGIRYVSNIHLDLILIFCKHSWTIHRWALKRRKLWGVNVIQRNMFMQMIMLTPRLSHKHTPTPRHPLWITITSEDLRVLKYSNTWSPQSACLPKMVKHDIFGDFNNFARTCL